MQVERKKHPQIGGVETHIVCHYGIIIGGARNNTPPNQHLVIIVQAHTIQQEF